MDCFESALFCAGYSFICGIDESGRGPLAGPVVAAAVVLDPTRSYPGLRDSKKLSAKRRDHFFKKIEEEALAFALGIVDNQTIDEINILQATFLAMREALSQLQTQPDYILMDGFRLPEISIEQEALIHGDDRSWSIAAASVLAKVTRDRLMAGYDLDFPPYKFAKHKGYGTREHTERLREYGPCSLHRRSFRGVIS